VAPPRPNCSALWCKPFASSCPEQPTLITLQFGPGCAKHPAILVGMGAHSGFADLLVICEGRVLFLELRAPKGRLRPEKEGFREKVLSQGFGWALVRTVDDALGALADNGFASRVQLPARRVAP